MCDRLSAELRTELDELYVRYARTIDRGDAAGWARCFTPSGTFSPSSGGLHAGREALERFAAAMHETWRADGVAGRHWATNLLVEARSGSGDDLELRTSCYGFVLLARARQPPQIAISSVYMDHVVRCEGAWAFAARDSARDTA